MVGKKVREFVSEFSEEKRLMRHFFISAFLGDAEEVKSGLEKSLNLINIRDKFERTALHYAKGGDVVDLAVKYGADINATDVLGMTPLHCAVIMMDIPKIEALVKHGAKNNITDIFNNTPFSYLNEDKRKIIISTYPKEIKEEIRNAIEVIRNHYAINNYLNGHPEEIEKAKAILKSSKSDGVVTIWGLIKLFAHAHEVLKCATQDPIGTGAQRTDHRIETD